MLLTDHQAKYFAHELTRRWSSDSVEKFASAVAGAQVDLNPHQVDAALFAFKSPFSNGALLAEEVGLEHEIKDAVRQIQEFRRATSAAHSLEDKLVGQEQIIALESHRKERRRNLFDAQDEIDQNRDLLIEKIESKLKSKSTEEIVFTIRWNLN